jgi:integrase
MLRCLQTAMPCSWAASAAVYRPLSVRFPHLRSVEQDVNQWCVHATSCSIESVPPQSDRVFAREHGERITKVGNGFTELLKAAGLERDHRGIKRTPYSLRHFHISEQLANGAEVMDVAGHCRTFLVMIDKHYGQVRLERVVDRLRPEWTRA